MTDNNGWPDPARPGVPKNPERDGWHWLVPSWCNPEPMQWHAGRWFAGGGWAHPDWVGIKAGYSYLGHCLTPDQVAAAVQAERDACVEIAQAVADEGRHNHNMRAAAIAVCGSIRARGPADALAEALAQAERRGMDRATQIATAVANDHEWGDGELYIAKAMTDAIRAAMGGGE